MPHLAGLEVPLGRLDAAPPSLVAVAGGRQAARLLQQIRRCVRRTARGSAPGGGLERSRDLLVGLLGGQREMPCAFLRVVEDRREARVQ